MAGSTYDFDFGTAGVAATAADHADWTQVDNTMTYRANGRISTNTLEYGANTYNSFNIAPSATGVLYIQLYFMHSTRVADRHWLCAVYGGASEVVAQLSIRYDAGNYIIRARDKEIAAGTGTTQLAEDTWYRIDWTLNRTAGTQTCTLHAGANLDSATPTETIVAGGAGTLNDSTTTTMNEIRFGNHIAETSGSLVEFDRVAWSDTAMPSPYSGGSTDHTATPSDTLGLTDIAAAAKTTVWPVTREIQIG